RYPQTTSDIPDFHIFKIYNNYQYKFKEGLITSLDLSQIQTQYLSAETQYIQAIYNLINAKIELDKITNKL
ncbi:MAG: TolC family protein, partial [Flavobacteriales bacterium]